MSKFHPDYVPEIPARKSDTDFGSKEFNSTCPALDEAYILFYARIMVQLWPYFGSFFHTGKSYYFVSQISVNTFGKICQPEKLPQNVSAEQLSNCVVPHCVLIQSLYEEVIIIIRCMQQLFLNTCTLTHERDTRRIIHSPPSKHKLYRNLFPTLSKRLYSF